MEVAATAPDEDMSPLSVITVASNKGGVGKTTLATNLAIYLRALREDLPVLVLGLDDQDIIGRLFELDASTPERTALDAPSAQRASARAVGQEPRHLARPNEPR